MNNTVESFLRIAIKENAIEKPNTKLEMESLIAIHDMGFTDRKLKDSNVEIPKDTGSYVQNIILNSI
jgi:hypothetical protein